jgi:pimeloyl-ACP methyl ester carboxylesterase
VDGYAASALSRRHPLRVAATIVLGVLVVAGIAAGAVYLWLGSYAPLRAATTGFAPGSGVGADVQPVTGSGGRAVFFPVVRRQRTFDTAFTLRNGGRFTVTVLGLQAESPEAAPWVGPMKLLATTSATASADPGELLPFQSLRLARGDTAILVVRFGLRCKGATSKSPDVFTDRIRLRYRYLSLFTRTETVRLPFAVTLRCVGGPPATP